MFIHVLRIVSRDKILHFKNTVFIIIVVLLLLLLLLNGKQQDWYTIIGLAQVGIEVVPVLWKWDTRGLANSKHWFTTSFLQPLLYFGYAIGSRKLSANEQFFGGAQTVVTL